MTTVRVPARQFHHASSCVDRHACGIQTKGSKDLGDQSQEWDLLLGIRGNVHQPQRQLHEVAIKTLFAVIFAGNVAAELLYTDKKEKENFPKI
jgi:hypothetical protein